MAKDFDEEKFEGKFTRTEFQGFAKQLNDATMFKHNRKIIAMIVFIMVLFTSTGLAIWFLIRNATNDPLYYIELSVTYSVSMLLAIGIYCYLQRLLDPLGSYRSIVEKENVARSHLRGLHWSVIDGGQHLQSQFTAESCEIAMSSKEEEEEKGDIPAEPEEREPPLASLTFMEQTKVYSIRPLNQAKPPARPGLRIYRKKA